MEATLGTPLEARQQNGVRFYFSPLLQACSISHGFSTRIGGVSEPPFDSLTLGSPALRREDPARLAQNWRRLLGAISGAARHESRGTGCSPSVLQVHQVHGTAVTRAAAGEPWNSHAQADAIVSDDPVRPIAARTADCCPILLASKCGRRVAAVHAGWRGTVGGVIEAAVAAMDCAASNLLAAVGPCIGVEAFEVGPEVLAAFRARFGEAAPLREHRPNAKGHVDLAASVVLALRQAAVPANQISAANLCTFQNAAEFFSHRRDHGITGRMAAVIRARGDE